MLFPARSIFLKRASRNASASSRGRSPVTCRNALRSAVFARLSQLPGGALDQRYRAGYFVGFAPEAWPKSVVLRLFAGTVKDDVATQWTSRRAGRPAIDSGRSYRQHESPVGARVAR